MTELIVPRKTVYFAPQEGRLIKFSDNMPECLGQPLARVPNGPVTGLESGYRSGILGSDRLYKIKACRPSTKPYGNEPKGSQTFSGAQYEVERTFEIREMFLEELGTYPLIPRGFWVYDVLFRGEPNTATIYEIEGDTRLDEFLWWLEKDLPLVHEIDYEGINPLFRTLGIMTGRLVRILHNHNRSWDRIVGDGKNSNSYPGNVVVYRNHSNRLDLGLVDVDDSQVFNPSIDGALMKKTQKWELRFLMNVTHDYTVYSSSRLRKAKPISERLRRSAHKPIKDKTDHDIGTEVSLSTDSVYHTMLRDSVVKGIEIGYNDPDTFVPEISLDSIIKLREYIQKLGKIFRREFKQRTLTNRRNPKRKVARS